MNLPQTLKGFRDFLPQEALKRKWLRDKIAGIFELWGYDPIETPTIEPLELFAGQIGDDEKLFFKFEDNGGRQVALRYDQTVPTCRVVGQYSQSLPMPFRRYQIQPAFRAENTQRGRYREFTQCDADIFGVSSPIADAEVIALSLDVYRRLGFRQVQVLVNDRSLLSSLPYSAIVSLDKLEKIGASGVIEDMITKGISLTEAQNFMEIAKKLKPNQTIEIIFNYLSQSGFDPSWFRFEPTLARSFSYSTGPIWEVTIPGFESGSVLGGERFDNLVEKISGQKIPGTGFGIGFDRTLEAADQFGLLPNKKTNSKILVTIFSPELLSLSSQLASNFRANGINCELFPNPSLKIDKQLKYADRKSIPFVAIVGPDELANNSMVIKNLTTREQKSYQLDEIDKLPDVFYN